MKRFTSLLLAAVFIVMSFPLASAEENGSFFKADAALISEYFKAIGEQDYSSGFKLLSAGQRELMKSVEAQNSTEKEGIWSVSSVNSVELMCDATDSEELDKSLLDSGIVDRRSYLVKLNISVYNDNMFFYDGNNYLIITVGTEDGQRRIFHDTLALPDLILKHEDEDAAFKYFDVRFSEERGGYRPVRGDGSKIGVSHSGTMPSSIRVKRVEYGGGAISTVNFLTYCKYVACAEVGYSESGHVNYHKSACMAVKNFGWFRTLSPRSSSGGFHVHDNTDDQIYNPDRYNLSDSSLSRLLSNLSSIWNVIMVNSEKKIFQSFYATGSSTTYERRNRGKLYHYGAKLFANQGRSYSWILDYYYSNTKIDDYNNYFYLTSTGPITVCASHSGGTILETSRSGHKKKCSLCNYLYTENHTWRTQGQYMVCTVCGYSVMVTRAQTVKETLGYNEAW